MNIVIISGEIVSGIEFKFIYDRYGTKSKHTSISSCCIKLDNDSIIQIYGYDGMADFMYRHLKFGDLVICGGSIDSEGNIVIDEIENKGQQNYFYVK